MDVISLALALKALKNSSGGEGGSDIDFIHEVDDLNITEAETGVYKVNGKFYFYKNNDLLNIPNIPQEYGIDTSLIIIVSKSERPSQNETKWKWFSRSVENSDIFGVTSKTIDPNTQAVTYHGSTDLSEISSNKTIAITDSNKNDHFKYPSVKAVVDYVDSVLTDITETQY